MGKNYFVYILTNKYNNVLYTGVTNNLVKRVYEHKNKFVQGFTKRYNLSKLVYYEVYKDINLAITREKQIKGSLRKKKIELINKINSDWKDLFDEINN